MDQLTFYLENVVKAPHETMENFEGSLDLILFLLSKNKIEIRDIKISELVDQYLAYLDEMERLDLEVASEFTAMASHLVYIKTRMLLKLEEETQEMDELMLALEERRRAEELSRIRLATLYLAERYEVGRHLVGKPPEAIERDHTYDRTHNASELYDCMRSLFSRQERKLPPPPAAFRGIVGVEPFPVDTKIEYILTRMTGSLPLLTLLAEAGSRSERVATFLAVLELCHKGRLCIDGEDEYRLTLLPETREVLDGTA